MQIITKSQDRTSLHTTLTVCKLSKKATLLRASASRRCHIQLSVSKDRLVQQHAAGIWPCTFYCHGERWLDGELLTMQCKWHAGVCRRQRRGIRRMNNTLPVYSPHTISASMYQRLTCRMMYRVPLLAPGPCFEATWSDHRLWCLAKTKTLAVSRVAELSRLQLWPAVVQIAIRR